VALLPEAEPAAMLAAAGRRGRVLLVGHLPSLGRLAGWLIGGDPLLGLPLRTGSLCRIDLAAGAMAGQGDLRWLLPPSLLRRLVERGHGGDRLA
jgi:phosphohistidine phosphatase SixA